jgi:hypothetical protein
MEYKGTVDSDSSEGLLHIQKLCGRAEMQNSKPTSLLDGSRTTSQQ